jgi:hypothetical protein
VEELEKALRAMSKALGDAMTYGGVSGPIFDEAIRKARAVLQPKGAAV